jgi:hypothetical protein
MADIRAYAREKADELTINTLVDLAKAEKAQNVQCPKKSCGYRFNVPLADAKVRLDAATKLAEMGYGKAPTQKDQNDTITLDVDVAALSTEQRTLLRHAIFRAMPDLAVEVRARASI